MAKNSNIEWTDNTFNPWIGCTKVSEACDDCYAERDDLRWHWTPQGWGFGKPRHRTSAETWKLPLKWEREAVAAGHRYRVFCASLADVFDQEIDPSWRSDLWELIRQCPHLDWQILTKRPQHIAAGLPPGWGTGWPNVWLGTSVENQKRADQRIPHLVAVPAVVHFLSVEPLLDAITFKSMVDIEWVIVGGESGPKAKPMAASWVIDIQAQCQAASIPFFFKQWGGVHKHTTGRTLMGQTFDEFPK
jgi:protein gp37